MSDIIEDIRDLYAMCYSPAVIAARLHLTEKQVVHALRYCELPPADQPHWRQPQPDRTSDR